ncbi:MAG: hypothetical protein M1832_002413 [Thelocarpon impressellum]|nr:MAG: hypothetical protein M1832_002413 [Thelocarpon impressellum]
MKVTKSNLVPQPPPEIPRGLASFLSEVDPVHDGRWKDQVSKMDRYVDNEDVENFERIFAKAVGIGRDEANLEKWKNRRDAWKRENLPSNGIQPNGVGLPNGTGTHRAPDSTTMEDEISGFPEERPLPEWLWPSRDPTNRGQAFIDQRKVLYALHQDQSENKLAMQIYPPNVFRWVLDNGFFSRANIQRALRKPGLVEQVLPGQVVQAIVDFDPDMTILLTVLLAPVHLEAADLWEAVRLLIRSLGYPDITDQDEALLLTNGDGALTNGDVAMALEKEEEAAEQEMQLAVSSLENGDVRARALTLALTKLHLIEPSLAAQSLRKTMTGAEMISLIHLLRVEMARDGWLSRYFNDDADLDDEGAGLNGGIMLISDLLNVTLDGIGAGGWVTRGDPVDADELVVALQGEVSAALEGVEEATYLDGLLSEMLHYGKSVTRAGNSSVNKNAAPVPGSIIVQSEEMESRMLPLGLKAEQPVSLTRVGAGGEIKKRTLRDIGRLKSMRVGKYSIERIVL